jgi:zinc protease
MRKIALAAVLALALPALAEDTVHEKKLDNGLDVLVVEKHHAPIVTIEIAVKTGAFTEDRQTNGLSHLYEHMFFKGNAAIPTQEAYMKRMQELGIKFNGTTGNERVNYFITLPAKNFAAGMRFMSDALLTPLFNQEELEKERLVVIGEYDRNESRPDYFLGLGMNKAAYGDDALRKNALGERETILHATREIMVNFKNAFYIPNNSLLTIVGDVNETEAQVLVDRYFGPNQWKAGDDPHAAHPRPPMPRLEGSKAVVVVRDNVATPSLSCMWNGPDFEHDPHATLVADVWSKLLGLRSGRFHKVFRDGGLATQASLHYRTEREGGEIGFHATLRKGPAEVRDALLKEIAAMVDDAGYFSDEELSVAQHLIATDRIYQNQSGEALTHTLSFHWASASLDFYRTYVEESAKVSLADVRAFVKHYVLGRPYVIGFLVDTKDDAKIDQATLLATPPEQRTEGLAAGVTSFKLKNGVKAIVREEPGAQIAALEVFMDGGSAYLTGETQGVERFALAAALEGSKEFPRDALRHELEHLGARTSQESGYDYSRVGVQAPTDGFQQAMAILSSCLKEPELDEKTLDQQRHQIAQGFRREEREPDALLRKVGHQIFFAGHVYENRPEGTPETMQKFDAEALRKAVKSAMTPGRVLLVVVSPFGTDDVKSALEEKFGWIKAPEGGEPARAPIAAVSPTEKFRFAPLKSAETTYISGAFALPAPTDPMFPAARVLMTLMHERLWDAIRTKRALSYAPQARFGMARAAVGSVYASSTDPKKTIVVMLEEIARIKEELAPASDLKAVLAGDLTRRAQQSESSSAQAAALGRAELLQGSWRKVYEETDELSKVTPEQVRDAARKIFADVRWTVVGREPLDEKVLERN